jgi:ketosteroid isomerase-like protein
MQKKELIMPAADDLNEIMNQAIDALGAGLAFGNPEPFKALWSHEPDVTVLGGFGGYALGWEEVSQNTDFAASRFHGARSYGVKKLTQGGADGDLGFSVWIEHGEVRIEGREDYVPVVIRVTHIYRREGGAWRIIHRHGDPVTEKTVATAILQRP